MIYCWDVQFNEERSEAGQEVFTEEDKHRVELEFTTDDSTNDLFEIEVTSNNHENNTPSMNTQPVMRRSERTTRAPVFYGERANVSDSLAKEPTTLEEVLKSSNNEKWIEAMTKEMKSLDDNKV